jgi:hypothetical protein
MNSFSYSYENENMSISQNQSIITLLPKPDWLLFIILIRLFFNRVAIHFVIIL